MCVTCVSGHILITLHIHAHVNGNKHCGLISFTHVTVLWLMISERVELDAPSADVVQEVELLWLFRCLSSYVLEAGEASSSERILILSLLEMHTHTNIIMT